MSAPKKGKAPPNPDPPENGTVLRAANLPCGKKRVKIFPLHGMIEIERWSDTMASGPKMKSNRGAAKRFRKTKNGKFKRERAYLSHIRTKKSPKRKRRLRQQTLVSECEANRVRRMLAI